jgi:hypothetical protein
VHRAFFNLLTTSVTFGDIQSLCAKPSGIVSPSTSSSFFSAFFGGGSTSSSNDTSQPNSFEDAVRALLSSDNELAPAWCMSSFQEKSDQAASTNAMSMLVTPKNNNNQLELNFQFRFPILSTLVPTIDRIGDARRRVHTHFATALKHLSLCAIPAVSLGGKVDQNCNVASWPVIGDEEMQLLLEQFRFKSILIRPHSSPSSNSSTLSLSSFHFSSF